MWTRKELKAIGNKTFHLNYWKTVLIALIAAMVLGGAGGAAAGAGGGMSGTYNIFKIDGGSQRVDVEQSDIDAFAVPDMENDDISDLPEEIQQFQQVQTIPGPVLFMLLGVVFIVVLVVAAVAILISAFLYNPLEVGIRKFFVQNLHAPAEVKEIAFGYDHCYKNNVKTLFFRDLYLVLWSLLFIIPGIVKSYEYRMIPYLLADTPGLTTKEAFARSKELMRGQKWRTFVLDLSFLGWEILNLFTLGILGIFFIRPYREMTNAALYEALMYGKEQEESAVWTQS